MLQLLSPAGLWALAALSLPLVIHLWRPPPRTVRLGSLRFLENLPRRLHDLRWRERALLAARLALLALLALLLAGPRWQRPPSRAPQRWVLLDPHAAPVGGSADRLRVLRSDGYETHTLEPGFPTISTIPQNPEAAAPDLWSLLREADAELPAGSALAVFSPGWLASLRGSRPALRHCRVDWVQTPDAPPAPGVPTTPAAARTLTPLGVLILPDPDRTTDARYLRAAVLAAGDAAHPLDVQVGPGNPTKGNQRWMVWLSAKLVPPAWTGRGANVVSEAAASAVPADANLPASWIVPAPGVPGASAFLDPVRLWQRAPAGGTPGAVWWTDGFGQPLLTVTHEGGGRHWRFFGRFDPAWTDLPRGSAFPAWMRAMLWSSDDPSMSNPMPDRRLADPSQCRPADTPSSRAENVILSRVGENAVDLHGPLWVLAAVLFGLERALSNRRRPLAAVAPLPELVSTR